VMLVCPYCRAEIAPDDPSLTECAQCKTPHHSDCWGENGGCTLFGCKLAPPDEPKVEVSTTELSFSAGTAAARTRPNLFGDTATAPALAYAPAVPAVAPPPPPPPMAEATAVAPSAPSPPPSNVRGYVAPGSIFSDPQELRRPPKTRIAFVLLGIFFGALGVHNFYAGYIKRGVVQACITVLTVGYASVISWIWAIVEVCTVDRDARDIQFL
jgi:hypothetical protein